VFNSEPITDTHQHHTGSEEQNDEQNDQYVHIVTLKFDWKSLQNRVWLPSDRIFSEDPSVGRVPVPALKCAHGFIIDSIVARVA
jgi:hypothetical protein